MSLMKDVFCVREESESRGEPGNYCSKASQALHKEEYVFK